MVYEYSNIILFYCFANKLIAVTEKINDMMSNDNIYQTLPLSNALLNYLQKWEMLPGPLWEHNGWLMSQLFTRKSCDLSVAQWLAHVVWSIGCNQSAAVASAAATVAR